MSFGLKNVGATYQRLMNKIFPNKIGKTMEVYVDNMLVKSLTIEQHIEDLTDTFASLRLFNMRLNPEKWIFGIEAGKFLGFIVFQKGIEVNLKRI